MFYVVACGYDNTVFHYAVRRGGNSDCLYLNNGIVTTASYDTATKVAPSTEPFACTKVVLPLRKSGNTTLVITSAAL